MRKHALLANGYCNKTRRKAVFFICVFALVLFIFGLQKVSIVLSPPGERHIIPSNDSESAKSYRRMMGTPYGAVVTSCRNRKVLKNRRQ